MALIIKLNEPNVKSFNAIKVYAIRYYLPIERWHRTKEHNGTTCLRTLSVSEWFILVFSNVSGELFLAWFVVQVKFNWLLYENCPFLLSEFIGICRHKIHVLQFLQFLQFLSRRERERKEEGNKTDIRLN